MTAQNLFEPDRALIIPSVSLTAVSDHGSPGYRINDPALCLPALMALTGLVFRSDNQIYNSGKGSSRFCDACKWQVFYQILCYFNKDKMPAGFTTSPLSITSQGQSFTASAGSF